ncbi:hypothetical protein MNV49_000522 [Pseudohyphozyma bogoriensis]|nr:hypothetical protein MNV49_000522 [Pseudohyphozyma bogoriensis]
MHLAALWTMTLFCAIAPWIVLEKVILPPHTPLVLRTAGQVWLGAGEALIIWLARKQVKGGKIALPEDDEKSLGRRDS